MVNPPFVLLDDASSAGQTPSSRLYTGFARELRCCEPATLEAVWLQAERAMRAGLHCVVTADYEWGAKLMRAGHHNLAADDGSALRLLFFRSLARLSRDEVSTWLAGQEGRVDPAPAGVLPMRPSVDRAAFGCAIDRVRELIRAGETYQVNYTYRLAGEAIGSPIALYRRLRARQPVPFGALLALPDDEGTDRWVLSCSPELFLAHRDGSLAARPMKGTVRREADPARDAQAAAWLSRDEKNRCENLMIVDLLRNDLNVVSVAGSVKVSKLFAVETYSTVHQMTSTIESEIDPRTTLPDILRALFPCGSITGAPKLRTMQLIAGLETTPRGIYTGAIGWLDAPAPGRRCGDFSLSVAIRTLAIGPSRGGLRSVELGVGGGIVIDSSPQSEYEETRLKAHFVEGMDPGFTLFETLRLRPGGRLLRLDAHLARLENSAASLGFLCDKTAIRQQVSEHVLNLPADGTYRIRLDLAHDGRCRVASSPTRAFTRGGRVGLMLSHAPVPREEAVLSHHKTSLRTHYDAAIREAEAQGAFDTLFLNERAELTEGARSNVFVKRGGRWWTPPLASGLLPGVMRARLVRRLGAAERLLSRDDLSAADDMLVCSSLRGVSRAYLTGTP
ncbi:aminodeoxychorismate synthase component I [Bordetella sp. FB-8]|uniref:aminodeoxychorismate synthase component I n=1 Tax=Bordetella sp. FB-8 TaxID=1159870 RepID=UPI000360DD9E|nr:aminodeoxychorismate synthase component I [Bordetella sp. FB-8]